MNDFVKTIQDLSDDEVVALIVELQKNCPQIYDDYVRALKITGQSPQEVGEYVVMNLPKAWAKVYLNWDSRDYQDDILLEGKNSRRLVLRLGRRLGKTETMCILILWHAFVQPNAGDNGQYNILIITPFETQIQLIFTRLRQLIDGSDIFKGCIVRDIENRLELSNGTIIQGLTAGTKSGNGAAGTRGQAADLIVLDEVDYMGRSEITNVINIANEAPERIKILVASTPSGKRENFYEWCNKATRTYKPLQEDIDNFRFTGFTKDVKAVGDGNGWTQIYAPSTVNKELLKVNEDTGRTYLEDLREELTEIRFAQEVMAEFGEEELGVYLKKHIDAAIAEGRRCGHKYTSNMNRVEFEEWHDAYVKMHNGPIILGVDWDKYSASTNFVILGLDMLHTDANGRNKPTFKIWDRIEIPRDEFTYTNAMDRIIELNEIYEFDWIYVDRGYGEVQVEYLHKYGLLNPHTGLQTKVVGKQFSEKISVIDPYTGVTEKKPFKPFMVNNSVMTFERNAITFAPDDHLLISQLEQYRVKTISANGVPTYTNENEHILDAMNLALVAMEQNYGELFRSAVHTTKILSIPRLHSQAEEDGVVNRTLDKPKVASYIQEQSLVVTRRRQEELMSKLSTAQGGRSGRTNTTSRTKMPSRRSF